MSKRQNIGLLLSIVMLAVGCHSDGSKPPVITLGEINLGSNKYHVVAKGETLYSISFHYGLDYKHVAAVNNIHSPYYIYADQKILIEGIKPRRQRARQKTVAKHQPQKPPLARTGESQHSNIKWRWPVKGELIRGFALTGNVNKGVDIRGQLGESVGSAADGVIVYAGGGLGGYGKLVIVKHNERFLSAYGHNRKILVKEGDKVKGGQVVAEIGSSGPNLEMLHFEIRRDGKPEDPLIYLPR